MSSQRLVTKIQPSDVSREASRRFDIKNFNGTTEFLLHIPAVDPEFRTGLIVGPSGTGKTTLMRHLCPAFLGSSRLPPSKRDRAKLRDLGLDPRAMGLPYEALSPGERHRVDLTTLNDHLGVDEFTSGIDRPGAWAMAAAVSRLARNMKGVVFATVHDDVAPYLRPSWMWYTDKQQLVLGKDIVPYSISCVGAGGAGTKWMPEQTLQTTANSVVGGRSHIRIKGVKPGNSLATLVRKHIEGGGPDDKDEELSTTKLRMPSTTLELLITPCEQKDLSAFRAQGFGKSPKLSAKDGTDCYWVTHQGTPCAVVSGTREVVAPRYTGFRLIPHILQAVNKLRKRGVINRGTICSRAGGCAASTKGVHDLRIPSNIPAEFSSGLIVGPSGTGKSVVARKLFPRHALMGGGKWCKKKAIVDQFGKDVDVAVDKLMAVGLDSIPSWLRPYHVLSNGEQKRVDLAKGLRSDCIVEDFTSAIDRPSAQSMAASVARYIRTNGLRNVVFVSSHPDILPFLRPDWVWHADTHTLQRTSPTFSLHTYVHPNVYDSQGTWEDTAARLLPTQRLRISGGGSNPLGSGDAVHVGIHETLPRAPRLGDAENPQLHLVVQRCSHEAWKLFHQHHYLTSDLARSARCFIGSIAGKPCAFVATVAAPGKPWCPTKACPQFAKKHIPGIPRWRESRLVVLPAYQGLGIGTRIANIVADSYVRNGHQYFSRTSHPKLVKARQRDPNWNENEASGNVRKRSEYRPGDIYNMDKNERLGYSFEYMGTPLHGKFHFRDMSDDDISCPSCMLIMTNKKQRTCANCKSPLTGKGLPTPGQRKAGWSLES